MPAPGMHSPGTRLLDIGTSLLDANRRIATDNRRWFEAQRQCVLNLVSSPGSGKTTLLEATARAFRARGETLTIIEGDQATTLDADRVRAAGARAIQINTGKLCHLEAVHVQGALNELGALEPGILCIENVGNLICPAHFDLGELARVTLLSVTEGDDKPLKYPDILRESDLLVITKCDLLPWVHFDIEACIRHALTINPRLEILQVSSTDAPGIAPWLSWLDDTRATYEAESASP